jgi:thioredoxin 1
MSTATAVSKADFETLVNGSPRPVLVDFSAEWCGPCKMIAPVINEIAEAYKGRVDVFTVDVDSEQELAVEFDVMTIPTIIIFKGGKVVERFGFTDKARLSRALDEALAA